MHEVDYMAMQADAGIGQFLKELKDQGRDRANRDLYAYVRGGAR